MSADPNPISPGCVLVVDDEVRLMSALRDTLRDQGYEVVGVTTGAEALATLQLMKFDLLLTDLMMPEMDGITLLKAALAQDPDLVGLIMTGQGTIATAVEAMQVGAFDYLLKPFKLSAILPVLTRALALRKLRRQNADLQKRLHARTADLEVANRELESFAHSVSHDLRSPLRAVGGFAHMVQNDCADLLPVASRQHLQNVIDGAARMDRLIDDLLRFSQSGRQSLTRQTVVMAKLVEEVLQEIRTQPDAQFVEVVIGSLPDGQADPALLRQVLVNLVSNAVKFTRGKTTRRVEIGCTDQKGENVYFIRDNGAGFDPRYASKLFDVFQRLHRADEFEGTGVGLSIVQRIIQRHGGRIWAEGNVGQGATFSFTLPASPARC